MQSVNKKTLVMGASSNPSRYSYLALNRLINAGYTVEAIGKKEETVSGVNVHSTPQTFTDIDTVTLYLNAQNQKAYYDYILSLHPKRIIFNPGAENAELEELARQHNITTMEACTLVLLATGQY
jgi:uncharacterized protein